MRPRTMASRCLAGVESNSATTVREKAILEVVEKPSVKEPDLTSRNEVSLRFIEPELHHLAPDTEQVMSAAPGATRAQLCTLNSA